VLKKKMIERKLESSHGSHFATSEKTKFMHYFNSSEEGMKGVEELRSYM
jgi:hypothetical protein